MLLVSGDEDPETSDVCMIGEDVSDHQHVVSDTDDSQNKSGVDDTTAPTTSGMMGF